MTQLVDALDIMGERGEEQVTLAEPGEIASAERAIQASGFEEFLCVLG